MTETAGSTADTIRRLLADVLYIEPAEVADDVTFLDLGLDSIIAVEFVAALRDTFARPVTLDEVYESATVPVLAARLTSVEA